MDYIPKSANAINVEQRENWGIKLEYYFTIIDENAESLLVAFTGRLSWPGHETFNFIF